MVCDAAGPHMFSAAEPKTLQLGHRFVLACLLVSSQGVWITAAPKFAAGHPQTLHLRSWKKKDSLHLLPCIFGTICMCMYEAAAE